MALEILGIASDIAGCRLGSANGVALLCDYMKKHNLGILHDRDYLTLDSANIQVAEKEDYAKHIALLYDFFKNQVAQNIMYMIHRQAFPFIISGDHSSALAAVQGVQNALPNDTIGIIWIDAHADIHTPLSTFSGNLHGMPLAALIGHKAANKNIITESQMQYWEKISNISKDSINPQNVIYCGVRSLEQAEQDVIDLHKIPLFSVESLRNDRESCIHAMQKHLSQSTKIYVSVDIDVLDCNVFESTGCNEINGLYENELLELVKDIIASFHHKIAAFELSEFNPKLGNKQQEDKEMVQDFLHKITESLRQHKVPFV